MAGRVMDVSAVGGQGVSETREGEKINNASENMDTAPKQLCDGRLIPTMNGNLLTNIGGKNNLARAAFRLVGKCSQLNIRWQGRIE
jgi:hypothetical protein